MADNFKIPEFIKDGAKAAMEPLNKLEEKLNSALKKVSQDSSLSQADLKNMFQDGLKWVKATRSDLDKAIGEGVTKAFSLLNLPTREDLSYIDNKLSKLTKDLSKIEKKVSGKDKPAAKKPVVKKAAKKPAVKKAVKKPAVKKAAKK